MTYLKFVISIFIVLAASRFVPHPPNFTSLIALSFYVPAFFGVKFLVVVLMSFILTDIFIGFHQIIIFTWGSVILIGLISKYFSYTITKRLVGVFFGAIIFFVVTNFGVWALGSYGYSVEGLIKCYVMAIPFFVYTLISTLVFSSIIEGINVFFRIEKLKNK
tara:strand:- start:58 stop:543 length:486 start_codon:yes stop_codon:yes gene_type:complete